VQTVPELWPTAGNERHTVSQYSRKQRSQIFSKTLKNVKYATKIKKRLQTLNNKKTLMSTMFNPMRNTWTSIQDNSNSK